MTKVTGLPRLSVCLLCALLLPAGVAAQEGPTVLLVDLENYTMYLSDVTDVSKLARSPGPLTVVDPANFVNLVTIADVTAINGTPAKGAMVMQMQYVRLTPTPPPGRAIGDITREVAVVWRWEFLKADGSPFGSLFGVGFGGGPPAPGSTASSINGNNAITGGTGAYVGVKGTLNMVQTSGGRVTSQAEDPSMRRTHGGAKVRFALQIFPMFRPEIVLTPAGPAVFHQDFTPVTPDKPAQKSETLILYAKGLGPTNPPVNPGDPFPADPLALVTSPVDVLVGGKAASATNQLGIPGTTDTYRIDFQLPDSTAAGMVPIQISAAWITGTAVPIPVR